jgi:hypothetical protein
MLGTGIKESRASITNVKGLKLVFQAECGRQCIELTERLEENIKISAEQ